MNQVKKMKPIAPQTIVAWSPPLTPTQTKPSVNCWMPAKSGISPIGR